MFPTFGRRNRKRQAVPRQARNFMQSRIHPIADRLGIPRSLVTFQVMRRTLGTDMQDHGKMKDTRYCDTRAFGRLLLYIQEIQASVRAAVNSRTRAIFRQRRRKPGSVASLVHHKRQPNRAKVPSTTVPNGSKLSDGVAVSC